MARSIRRPHRSSRCLLALGFGIGSAMSIVPVSAQELCGGVDYPFPYTDVSSVGSAFCPGIMEAYVTGVSKGTTPTTFSPTETVTRVQMTTFLQRSLDQGLTRANRRAALNRWWTSKNTPALQTIGVGSGQFPQQCDADGENIWVSAGNGNVTEVQASTGKVLGTWTGAIGGTGILAALGKVFVAGASSGDEVGILYVLDPTKPPTLVLERC